MRPTPDWARFHEGLDKRVWQRVSSLVRYCSARGIGPSEVSDEIFGSYWGYRAETTGLATHNTAKRFMVRAWNACAAATGWLGSAAAHGAAAQDGRARLGGIPRTACGRS